MNTAVRQAIETRIAQLTEAIDHATEVLTSYQAAAADQQQQADQVAASIAQATAERDELQAALPEPDDA